MDELDEEALKTILLAPKNALTKQFKRLLHMDGVHLEFDPGAVKAIVEIAVSRGTGARALRAVMEEFMLDVMFTIPSMPEVKSCLITEDVVRKGAEPVLTYESVKKSA